MLAGLNHQPYFISFLYVHSTGQTPFKKEVHIECCDCIKLNTLIFVNLLKSANYFHHRPLLTEQIWNFNSIKPNGIKYQGVQNK